MSSLDPQSDPKNEFAPGIVTRGMIVLTSIVCVVGVLFVNRFPWLLGMIVAFGLVLNITVILDISRSGIPFFTALRQWSARERRSRTRWIWTAGAVAFGLFLGTRR